MHRAIKSVVTVALLAGGIIAGGAPAHAAEMHDTGVGGCISGIGGQWGGYTELKIDDSIQWQSATALHIDYSNAVGSVSDCGPAGHEVSGGSYTLTNSWNVTGIKLSECGISIKELGCKITGGTIAKTNYKKSGKNSGSASYKGGGWNIYATTSGSVNKFQHDATYRLTVGDNTSDAGSSNVSRH